MLRYRGFTCKKVGWLSSTVTQRASLPAGTVGGEVTALSALPHKAYISCILQFPGFFHSPLRSSLHTCTVLMSARCFGEAHTHTNTHNSTSCWSVHTEELLQHQAGLNVIAQVLPSPIGPWWRADGDPSGMALRPLELEKKNIHVQKDSLPQHRAHGSEYHFWVGSYDRITLVYSRAVDGAAAGTGSNQLLYKRGNSSHSPACCSALAHVSCSTMYRVMAEI